ncbi:hypothetical protein CFP56_017233 [Quercus suber]|uniref:Uncharacterized protein n=1 Tax=Quercus suber TaxID=58331 RepID=A0AAW0KLY8_QUESU
MWVTDSGCRDTISQAWSCSPGGTAIVWDPGKLAACFLPWEADKVRGIYVAEDEAEDVLIWPLSSSGSYSVRSAYPWSVWMSDPGFLFLTQKKYRSFLEVLESLFSAGSSFQCAQFAMTAWCLWERRNCLRVHQRTWQLHEIGARALKLVQEFWDVHCKETSSNDRPPRVRWTPPPDTCYKLNFYVALLDGFNQVGLGVVCRDS